MRWVALAFLLVFAGCSRERTTKSAGPAKTGEKARWAASFDKAEADRLAKRFADAQRTLGEPLPAALDWADERAHRLQILAQIADDQNYIGLESKLLTEAEDEARNGGAASAGRLIDIVAAEEWNVYSEFQDAEGAARAMARVSQVDVPARMPNLYAGYGYALLRCARYEDALRWFLRAEPGITAKNRPGSIAAIYQNIGNSYFRLLDMERALPYLKKAEALQLRINDQWNLRICQNNLGLLYLDGDNFALASEYLNKALVLARKSNSASAEAEVLSNLARMAIAQKDWTKAQEYNAQALAIKRTLKDRDADLYALVNDARIQAGRGDFDAAIRTLDDVWARPSVNLEPRLDAGHEYVSIYRRLHNEAEARRRYEAALKVAAKAQAHVTQEEDRLSSFRAQNDLDREWVRMLVEEGKAEESLAASEAARSRMMQERMGAELAERVVPASVYRSMASARHAAFVTYWLMPEASYVWVVTGAGMQVRTIAGEPEISSNVARYRAFLEKFQDPLHTSYPASRRLREILLDPIAPLLRGQKEIFIVPDGALNSLNFETIPVGDHYWIDDVTLSVAPSLKVLAMRGGAATAARPGVLILGDPTPTKEYPRLESASREIDAVAKTFPGRARIFRGGEATAAAYLDDPAQEAYIHFAAHASANRIEPLQSAVILSGTSLFARDVLRKPIPAQLVTISACQSAGARSYQGEGLIGLAWVFLQSGARGVIAGLWDASDTSTSEIMSRLYGNLAQGQPPAQALRNAKLALRIERPAFRLPYFWAPMQYYRGTPR